MHNGKLHSDTPKKVLFIFMFTFQIGIQLTVNFSLHIQDNRQYRMKTAMCVESYLMLDGLAYFAPILLNASPHSQFFIYKSRTIILARILTCSYPTNKRR